MGATLISLFQGSIFCFSQGNQKTVVAVITKGLSRQNEVTDKWNPEGKTAGTPWGSTGAFRSQHKRVRERVVEAIKSQKWKLGAAGVFSEGYPWGGFEGHPRWGIGVPNFETNPYGTSRTLRAPA